MKIWMFSAQVTFFGHLSKSFIAYCDNTENNATDMAAVGNQEDLSQFCFYKKEIDHPRILSNREEPSWPCLHWAHE